MHIGLAIALIASCSPPSRAVGRQPPLAAVRSFDGPGITWQLISPGPMVQLIGQACVSSDAREGSGSERVIVAAPGGETVQFVCAIDRLPVLEELEAQLWVKANRPGVSLSARVVLPRSIDHVTNAPRTVIISGTQYDQIGRWQQLSLSMVPQLLAQRVRVMRTAIGATLDPREAFVDAIVLGVPGGPGAAEVWTDALAVDGIVASSVESTPDAAGNRQLDAALPQTIPREAGRAMGQPPPSASPNVQGTTLSVAGNPFLTVAIQWNAEPLDYLADRGFNAVWTRQPPTADDTAAAIRAGIWFVCPPPGPDAIAAEGLRVPLERVLAWDLGRPGEHDFEHFQRWAEIVRRSDPCRGRPIIISPRGDWLVYSRLADILLAEHPAGSRLSPAEYAEWLEGLTLLARPGTMFWVSTPTQSSELARRQSAALLPNRAASASINERQLAGLARSAIIGGCRGFLFQSHAPLNVADDPSKRRAAVMELINRRFFLLEPWLTMGMSVCRFDSSDQSMTASMLQVERARLVLPTPTAFTAGTSGSEIVASPNRSPEPKSAVAFVVPGVPDAHDAYSLTLASMERIPSSRVPGGARMVVERDEDVAILITDDPTVVAKIRQRVAGGRQRAAVLQRDLAMADEKAFATARRMLSTMVVDTADLTKAQESAATEIRNANLRLAANDFGGANRAARSARIALEQSEQVARHRLELGPKLFSSPFYADGGSLVEWVEFSHGMDTLRPGDNLLYGGDFEDLAQLTEFGWRKASRSLPGIVPSVELSPLDPQLGRYSLKLSAVAEPGTTAPQVVARPLVQVTSPPIQVVKGQVLEISGWVRVPEPIVGSIDGLTIVDSLGGPELALRVHESAGWQPFRMIRGVPAATDLTLSFSLSGTGTALIDAVMVRPLSRPTIRRMPEVSSPEDHSEPHAAAHPRQLQSLPQTR